MLITIWAFLIDYFRAAFHTDSFSHISFNWLFSLCYVHFNSKIHDYYYNNSIKKSRKGRQANHKKQKPHNQKYISSFKFQLNLDIIELIKTCRSSEPISLLHFKVITLTLLHCSAVTLCNNLIIRYGGIGEIWTRDLCVPNAESYQARPRSQ